MKIPYQDILNQVKSLNAIEVAERYIYIKKKGKNKAIMICPFHNDRKAGSFFVFEDGYYCFSCGSRGNIANLIAEIKGLEFLETLKIIAVDYHLMSETDSIKRTKDNSYKNKKISQNNSVKKIRVENKVTKQDKELNHFVYESLLKHLRLSDNHRNHLIKDRQLSDKQIEKTGYKSIIRGLNVSDKVIKDMEKYGYQKDRLKEVPGFFQLKVKDEGWLWMHLNLNGIVIPLRDVKRQITGLQIRLDDKNEGGNRYIWFSSGFAINPKKKNIKSGTSSGALLDIEIPENPNQTIFITEGKFKSEKIIEKWHTAVISVQGVTNWKGVEEVIRDIEEQTGEFMNVVIAFDSDSKIKIQVLEEILKMTVHLEKSFPEKIGNGYISSIFWDQEYKGIDDLIINDMEHTVYSNKMEDLTNIYQNLAKKKPQMVQTSAARL